MTNELDALLLLQANDLERLARFHETTDDEQTFDISKDAVKRLCELGCIQSQGFGRYGITQFGLWVLKRRDAATPTAPPDRGAMGRLIGEAVPYGRLLGMLRWARAYVADPRLIESELFSRKRNETTQEHADRLSSAIQANEDVRRFLAEIDETLTAVDSAPHPSTSTKSENVWGDSLTPFIRGATPAPSPLAETGEAVQAAAARLLDGLAKATVSDHGFHDDINTVIRAALTAAQPADGKGAGS